MSAPVSTATEKNIVRKTNAHTGRRVCISPKNSSMSHLAYSRIILNAANPSESLSTGDRETGLICLSGEATISVDGKEIPLAQRDAIYIPRDSNIKIATKSSADLAEFSCDVANRYPLQVVRATEIAKDPGLQFTTGTPGCIRHLQMLLAKNIQAGRLGKELEPYHLFWLEDPTPAELQESFRLIRRHTTTPLAVGEVFNSIYDCQQLIQEQLIDYIRTAVVHAGGISHVRKIASLAEIYQVRTGCHGATDMSPVCSAAALHFDLSVPNFGIQEYMRHANETDRVFPHAYTFADGMMHPGDTPGLGVDIDEQLASKYPYSRAYLPINRKLDGTMHSW